MCYRERELADLKYQKKKLNLCKWHIPEAIKCPFAGLLRSYRSHAPLLPTFCTEAYDFMHIKCSCCKLLSQKISRDEEFTVTMLDRLDLDTGFLKRVCFSDKSTFHISGSLNRHNLRIWGLENPHNTYELEWNSPKLNVLCRITHDKIIGPFLFAEKSVTAQIYHNVLTKYVSPQLEQY